MARTKSKPNQLKPSVVPRPDAPALTQENFEKELLALKAKAQTETWGKWAVEQASILFQSATLLSLAAIYSNVSQLTLSPVYGSYSASIWHSKAVMAACFVGWSGNLMLRRTLSVNPALLLPVVAAYIPLLQFELFKFSGQMGAHYGPLVTETLTLLPLVLLSVSCTATTLDGLELNPGRWAWLSESAPGVLSFVFFRTVKYFSTKVIVESIGEAFIQTRLGLQILLTGLYTLLAPSKLVLYALPALLHTAFFNTHVQLPYTTGLLNSTLHEKGWSLLERHESLTGYISIIESQEKGFRVMRCDHSLLGGEWLQSEKNKILFPEPIYAIFVQLEAVRLVEVPVPVLDYEASALVIGLGIGTTPSALMAHGIDTTIVEIDPVVHDFATRYFALPQNHTKVIEDAVTYASQLAQTSPAPQFDYIVHDVFTGGAEPVELFTLEFLRDLHTVLKPGGVIALNYAGDLLLPSSRIVIHTILTIFPNCRIYREHPAPPASTIAADGRDFTNVMLFCTKPSPSSSSIEEVTFRKASKGDFLGSRMREMTLVPKHEVRYEDVGLREGDGGVLLRNGTERFGKWQQTSAMGHWAVMRTVLPREVWEEW